MTVDSENIFNIEKYGGSFVLGHILWCKILVSQPKMTFCTSRALVTRKLSQTNKAKAHTTSQIWLLLSSFNKKAFSRMSTGRFCSSGGITYLTGYPTSQIPNHPHVPPPHAYPTLTPRKFMGPGTWTRDTQAGKIFNLIYENSEILKKIGGKNLGYN